MLATALRIAALAMIPETVQPPPKDVPPEAVGAEIAPEAPPTAVPEAPPAVDTAPAVTPVAAPKPAAPTPEPPPRPSNAAPSSPPVDLPMPRYRGTGLFISAGILGAAWVSLKMVSTVIDLKLAAEIDRGEYDDSICAESCYSGWGFNAMSAPVLLSSVALVGGGMHVHGRWTAFRDARRGVPQDLRRTRLRIRLGLGLVGAGLGSFVVSRIALWGPRSETGVVTIRELGWWLAAGGLYSGAMLAGHGHGHRVGRRKAEARARMQVMPVLSRHSVGLGAAGRF
jgi:hypothetical protein